MGIMRFNCLKIGLIFWDILGRTAESKYVLLLLLGHKYIWDAWYSQVVGHCNKSLKNLIVKRINKIMRLNGGIILFAFALFTFSFIVMTRSMYCGKFEYVFILLSKNVKAQAAAVRGFRVKLIMGTEIRLSLSYPRLGLIERSA